MSTLPVEIDQLSCVLIGSFNPAIVQPSWLARQGLVQPAEADAAEIRIIQAEISAFELGPFAFQVMRERFQITVANAGEGPALRDIVVGVLALLGQTPVTHVGFNRRMHMRMSSQEQWHQVGHRLAPKAPYEGLLDEPGMRAVVIWGKRPHSDATRFEVRVEPSEQVKPGVFISTNCHYDLGDIDGASAAGTKIAAEWDEDQRFALQFAKELVSKCLEPES